MEARKLRSAEGRGRTLDEAVDAALIQLAESRRNVDVKVLSETAQETVVQVSVIDPNQPAGIASATLTAPALDPVAERGRELVGELIERMGIRGQVSVRQSGDPIVLDVSGRDLGPLIGWRGENLRALQTVVNMLMSKVGADRRLIIDVERYRQRREHTVREIAFRAARQVKVTGDPITLDAMQPFERRAIHLALEDDPDVTTVSVGEEPNRRLVVEPRRAAQ
jgi:spoIIIJ-associated protein